MKWTSLLSLKPGCDESDDFILSTIAVPGYDIYNVPRGGGDAHGGVAVLYKSCLTVTSRSCNCNQYTTFEFCDMVFTCGSKCFTLVTVYRPYPSAKNKFTVGLFFEEFSQFLQDCAIAKGGFVLVGDLNLHLDVEDDPDTQKFAELMDCFSLSQFVVGPTHRDGHTLDVVISRNSDNLIKDTTTLDMISDHMLIACSLQVKKPKQPMITIKSRKFRSLDSAAFKEDIKASALTTVPATNVCDAVEQYNTVLSNLMDQHAPVITKSVVPRVRQPWFSDTLHNLKRDRRRAERRWITTRDSADLKNFKETRNEYNVALYNAKCTYYNNQIIECGHDYKGMFSIMGDILQNRKVSKLPDHDCPTALANKFADCFHSKIETIRSNMKPSGIEQSDQCSNDNLTFNAFDNVSVADISEIIAKSPSPSSLIDPVPSWIVKQQLDVLLPAITDIVNKSLTEGVVPDELKRAIINPLLKKSSLDHNTFKNYRPVSNLPFVSKVLERVVAKQLNDYLSVNNLHESMQSAYKKFHSTETALIKVHNDILWAMERQGVTILLLLDLSSAFDTIDHSVLIDRMKGILGMGGTALEWLKSYLSGRTQRVHINGAFSDPQLLHYGVPQGSVLGPLLFLIYTLPIGTIIRKYGFELHVYADDTQIYVCVCPTSADGVYCAVSTLEKCVREIQEWMQTNFLKLNAEKTEVLVLGFRAQLAKFRLASVNIAGVDVPVQSKAVRNLGVMFDCGMTMGAQVSNITRSANHQLINIGRARKMLTDEATKLAVHTLVTSRLDYCNSLLIGISDNHLQRLQNIQRTAARLISKKRKYDSISTELINLHWLPIRQRIDFKVLVLVFKSIHHQAPVYISNLLTDHTSNRKLRSTSSAAPTFFVPRTQCHTFADRSFSCYAPRIWNSLPDHIKLANSLDIFKTLLKTHLFNIAHSQ